MFPFNSHKKLMDTTKYDQCFAQQINAIKTFRPQIVVGKSFGGALLLDILRKVILIIEKELQSIFSRNTTNIVSAPNDIRVYGKVLLCFCALL
jgi:hypothetical protein